MPCDMPRNHLQFKGAPGALIIHDRMTKWSAKDVPLNLPEQVHACCRSNDHYDSFVQGRTRRLKTMTVALLLGAAGCETTPPASSFSAAVSRYEEGRYEMALSDGQAAARSDDSTLAAQGALVAGMSAFKLGQIDLAERLAQKACASPQQETSGSGWVLLGDVRLSQRRASDAAECFDTAAARLNGADSARASECAKRARGMVAAGQGTARGPERADTGAAKGMESDDSETTVPAPPWVRSKQTEPEATPPKAPEKTSSSKSGAAVAGASREYTIRAGSYQSSDAARKRAESLAGDLKRAKAPPARVDTITTVKGETLFAVRIGSWGTRADAERVMNTIGRRDLMVGAIAPDEARMTTPAGAPAR